MKQEFNFSSSNNKLEDESKIVDNSHANIQEQIFNFNLSINKKIMLSIITIIFFYIGFQFYQTKKINESKEREKLAHEKKINDLINEKNKIMNRTFDREAARKEINQLLKEVE